MNDDQRTMRNNAFLNVLKKNYHEQFFSFPLLIISIIAEEYKTPDNLIKGCQSRVWLHTALKDGKLFFTGDSDAVITKGLVSLMIYVLSGHTPQEIATSDIYFINAIGLSSHLSPTRSNGLLSMLKQMKMYSVAYQAKLNQQ